MNARAVAFVAVLLAGGACGGSSAAGGQGVAGVDDDGPHSTHVGEAHLLRRDVEQEVAAEKTALEALDRELAALDGDESIDESSALRAIGLRADRVARASYIAQLEACLRASSECPPTLAEPSPPAEWDAASGELRGGAAVRFQEWPDESARLWREACGCRTADCVAWVLAEIDRWESALPPAMDGDERGAENVTAARGCLWRRLGKK